MNRIAPIEFRGTNYFVATSTTLDEALGWLPAPERGVPPFGKFGFFSAVQVESEIRLLAGLGINNIRVNGSLFAWIVNRPAYIANLRNLCAICHKHAVSITFVFWDKVGNGALPYGVGRNIKSAELWWDLYLAQPWFFPFSEALFDLIWDSSQLLSRRTVVPPDAVGQMTLRTEPGNELFISPALRDYRRWPYNLDLRINAYVNDVASLFANELIPSEVFGSYDIFNEPDTVFPFLGPDITYDFIRATHDLIRAAHWSGSRIPNPELTVGLGGIDGTGASSTYDALARKGVAQTYVAGHIYPANVLELTQALRAGKAHARARNTHLVISEISAIAHSPGWLPSYLDVLSRENVATQIWGLIRSNFFLGGTPWKVWDGLVRSVPPKAFGVPVSFAVVDSEGVKAVEKWTGNN